QRSLIVIARTTGSCTGAGSDSSTTGGPAGPVGGRCDVRQHRCCAGVVVLPDVGHQCGEHRTRWAPMTVPGVSVALRAQLAAHERAPKVMLSDGLGADSTALLLRWIFEPEGCDFLRELVVVTATV